MEGKMQCLLVTSVCSGTKRDATIVRLVRLTMRGTAPRVHVRESDSAGVYTALPLDRLNVIESTGKVDKSRG